MKITLRVTVEMSPDQMQAWADDLNIPATEQAIRADLWGRDLGPLLDGSKGSIASIALENR